jgi:hypothetical protein
MIAWKKVWEWDFESVWGILNKIEYANQIKDRDLKNELKLTQNQSMRQEIKAFNLKAFMLDYDKLKELYNIDIIEKQKKVLIIYYTHFI